MLNFCFYQYTSYFRSFIDRKAFFTTNHYMSMDKKERLEVGLPTISDAIRVRKPSLASLLRKIQKKRIFFDIVLVTLSFPNGRFCLSLWLTELRNISRSPCRIPR